MNRWIIWVATALVMLASGCSSKATTWEVNVESIQTAQIRPALPIEQQWIRRSDRQEDRRDLAKLTQWLSAAKPLKKAPPAQPMHFNELVLELQTGESIQVRVALTCTSDSDGKGYSCTAERDTVEATRADWPGEWLRSPELYALLVGQKSIAELD